MSRDTVLPASGQRAGPTKRTFSASCGVLAALYDVSKSRLSDTEDADEFRLYFRGIAEARYVIRKVFRLVDQHARQAGLDPLEHQALIQVLGAADSLRSSELAERLDVSPALTSRIAKKLEARGYLARVAGLGDRRTVRLDITEAGSSVLRQIDTAVQLHIRYFADKLSDAERGAALGIFALYLDIDLGSPV